MPKKHIKVIDLFAGPGGLGEGFSALRDTSGESIFKIKLSIEKDPSAYKTLKLRSFFRQFPDGKVPDPYYRYLSGKLGKYPENELYLISHLRRQVQAAHEEVLLLELGKNNQKINNAIRNTLGKRPGAWVLIGGPPCQAYSIAGRSKNKSIEGYNPEEDHRNFLYREYLKIIAKFNPAIFVMENVRGMLSAEVGSTQIFLKIQQDLECPARTLKTNDKRVSYRLFSLVNNSATDQQFNSDPQPSDFIIKAEDYGIPQARHRVIILGIREDLASKCTPGFLRPSWSPPIQQVIGDLPSLRSGLSKETDSFQNWITALGKDISRVTSDLVKIGLPETASIMEDTLANITKVYLGRGSNWSYPEQSASPSSNSKALKNWFSDQSGWSGICNHESRGHMRYDLHRYLFCTAYSLADETGHCWTPKSTDFPKSLRPHHANWMHGHFTDRFRVQAADRVGTTVTSHISKDGHYYIHYDPSQCRSLTVREAARIQTFPDNYFFVGPRTQQYVQVGNAVPPYLANKVAEIVSNILNYS